jgi:hypothetical protein
MTIAAADPLNLTGIVTPGDRIRTASGNRLVYRNGVPLAALEGDMLRTLGDIDPSIAADVAAAAAGRRVPVVSGYVGRLATSRTHVGRPGRRPLPIGPIGLKAAPTHRRPPTLGTYSE